MRRFIATAAQRAICEKYGSSIIPYAPDEQIAVALCSMGKQPLYGVRVYPKAGETISWFFYYGQYSDAENFYQPICIEHAKKQMPEIEPYLCLDYGYKIIVDLTGYEDIWRE